MDDFDLNKIKVAAREAKSIQKRVYPIKRMLKPYLTNHIRQKATMKMSKVGNQTNSQDPQAVNSRVFVGNLNTFQCSKTDVERMFQRYGRLAGISMHKGYAFVQFTNPFDARSACLGEDGRNVLSQTLDVNMVAEPKPHQTGRKRQNISKTGNDWDYYYDSYYASTGAFPVGVNRYLPPTKKQRLLPKVKNGIISSNQITLPILDQLKVYSNEDILICGNCREMFSDLQDLLYHKKSYCKLRFTCKCEGYDSNDKDENSAASLLCVQCKVAFQNAWDLMVHVQAAHMVNIYELGVPVLSSCSPPFFSPNKENNVTTKQANSSPISEEQSQDNKLRNNELHQDGDRRGDLSEYEKTKGLENNKNIIHNQENTSIPEEHNHESESRKNGLQNVRDHIEDETNDYQNAKEFDDNSNNNHNQALSTSKTCIMHAVGVVSIPASSATCSASPYFASVAPSVSENGDFWKSSLSTSIERKAY